MNRYLVDDQDLRPPDTSLYRPINPPYPPRHHGFGKLYYSLGDQTALSKPDREGAERPGLNKKASQTTSFSFFDLDSVESFKALGRPVPRDITTR